MAAADPLTAWDDTGGARDCCAYLIDGQKERCGEPCELRSSYCSTHHQIIYVAIGSQAEAARLREFSAIARVSINGGRFPRGGIYGPISGEIADLERRSSLLALAGFRRRAPHTGNDP